MSDVFTASLARRGFDELLVRYPHLDVLSVEWGSRDETVSRVSNPWVIVCLGQPSQGVHEAWARWYFAVWKDTGSVYRMSDAGGPAEDDPYITVSEEVAGG